MDLPKKAVWYYWCHVVNTGPNQCWSWRGPKDPDGYGRFMVDRIRYEMHRVAFIVHNPTIDITGYHVMHKCDNPECSNPKHLTFGSAQDNVLDCHSKGRNAKGETHGNAKLTNSDIITICTMYHEYKRTMAYIAKKYCLNPSTVHGIVTRKSWKHI